MFIVLLTSLGIASSHTKCVSSRNQKCETWSTLINLHPNGFSQELHYHLFEVTLDSCIGSCNTLVMTNTLIDLSNKVCVSNETEDLNLNVFNLIIGVNKSRTLTNTAWKVSVFGVILVGIFPYSDWIQRYTPYSVGMPENTNQKNPKYGLFSCGESNIMGMQM